MKHVLKYTFALIGLLVLGMAGCTRDILIDDNKVSELSLSQQEVLLDSKTTTVDVKITTPDTSWNCITTADWLDCTKVEDKIRLTAKPNLSGAERMTSVIVTAGVVTKEIVVRQSITSASGDRTIFTDKTDFVVDQWGETFVIPVYSQSKNWEAMSSEEWVHIRSNQVKGTVQITVEETEARPDRYASVLVRDTNTGESFAVTISQKGIMFIILPYLEFGSGIDPILTFEEARKSKLIGRPGDNSGAYGAVNKDMWKFETKSQLFTRIEYKFANDKMTQAYAYSDIYALDAVYDEFTDHLSELGFVADERKFKFYNKKMEMMAELGLSNNEIYILYTYLPNQPEAYPTFETIPGRLTNVQGWASYDKDKIYEWESANGGVTNKKDGSLSTFSKTRTIYYTSTDPLAPEKTTYSLKPSSDDPKSEAITKVSFKFRESDTNKFVWEKDGIYYLTDEFMALCVKSKMRYIGKSGNAYVFNKPETGSYYRIEPVVTAGKVSVTMDVTP